MDEHKKSYSSSKSLIGVETHKYTDGVHSGTGYTQEDANEAYQRAKHEDLDNVHQVVKPDACDSWLWNSQGDKVERSSDDDSSSSNSDSSSSGGCFITTACVQAKGLPDNCKELTILRNFRDTYMRNLGNGSSEIENYYNTAPAIVSKINNRLDKNEIWVKVYDRLSVAINMIELNDLNGAYNYYKNLVTDLKELTD
jgi:hypothetical protein